MLRLIKGLASLTAIATTTSFVSGFEPVGAQTLFNCNLPANNLANTQSQQALAQNISVAKMVESREQLAELSAKFTPLPSLWWAIEQFDPFAGNLIDRWQADHQQKQIDLVVNWQLWSLLDYIERYRIVNQFGTVTREYGYSLRIFNHDRQCLAAYHYNFSTQPHRWEIYFNPHAHNNRMRMQLAPRE